MRTEICIDWYAATLRDTDKVFAALQGLSMPALHEGWMKQDRARNGYAAMMRHRSGIEVMWTPGRAEHGVHISVSGSALGELWRQGHSPSALIAAATARGWRATRVDVAVDVYDSGIDIYHLKQLYEAGNAQTIARKASYIHDIQGGGKTLYLGARSSQRFVRVYDKAKELGDGASDYIRIELETKEEVARSVAHALAYERDWAAASNWILSVIRGFIDYPTHDTWQKIFSQRAVQLASKPAEVSSVERWVDEQVIPALGRYARERDKWDYIDDVITRLTALRKTCDM